jgi:hypothetical protein
MKKFKWVLLFSPIKTEYQRDPEKIVGIFEDYDSADDFLNINFEELAYNFNKINVEGFVPEDLFLIRKLFINE